MTDLLLYSAKGCPFAHRTRLVLAHKQIAYELVEIDLQNKPVWYSDVSIYGKVPAIQHDGYRIVESSIINEYLDEVFTDRPLLSRRPSERALARILIDYANTRFVPAFGALLRERDIEAQVSARRTLVESLRFIERSAFPEASRGPFAGGSHEPGLVDFTFFPWFERWGALDHYRGVAIPPDCPRLRQWVEAISEVPAARHEAGSKEQYIERYARFASGARERA